MSDDDETAPLEPTYARIDPVIGSEVSGYRVVNRLGSGGMGIVYEGEQPVIGKRVAIKVLRQEVADDPEVVQRLVAEARAVNQVGHRGIIDVFGVGRLPDGRQCIVMEYLDGEPLENIIQNHVRQGQRLPISDVFVILDEVLSALAAAHSAGVIHRDLKPSNVFLCLQRDGTKFVKLLDFGIAKLGVLGKATPASRASMLMGTPTYMAPEQAAAGAVGPALDLYAMGVMAFELLTGTPPFVSESIVSLLIKHASEPPPHLPNVEPPFPPGLDALLQRLMAKLPGDRPPSAEAVRQELNVIRRGGQQGPLSLTVSVQRPRPSYSGLPAVKVDSPRPQPPEASTQVVPPDLVSTSRHVKPPTREPSSEPSSEPLVVPRSKAPWVAVAMLGLGALALGGLWLWPTTPAEPTPAPVHPTPLEASPVPLPAPVKAVVAEPAVSVDAGVQTAVTMPVRPAVVEPARPRPLAAGSPALRARIQRLESSLAKAEAAGENVALLRRALEVVKGHERTAVTAEARDSLEVTLSRLESELADF